VLGFSKREIEMKADEIRDAIDAPVRSSRCHVLDERIANGDKVRLRLEIEAESEL